ncbi:hypothetical protein K8Z49_29440 [Actinomadura madurae]|uniref:hypothetical protein n=1 Tax=Actinomadura madurae TaxID=1993 RepID=UPI00399AC0B2
MAMYLTFKSLTILSDHEVAITFTDSAGEEITYRFTATEGPIRTISGEDAFGDQYRLTPGPATPMWPERLVAKALDAYQDPLPAGETLEQLRLECREELDRRWRRKDSSP